MLKKTEASRRVPGKLVRSAAFVWKLLVGGFFCQYLFTAILSIGWTFRLMQRVAVTRWWSLSNRSQGGVSFRADARTVPALRDFQSWPGWFFHRSGLGVVRRDWAAAQGMWAKSRLAVSGPFGALKENLVGGVQGIFNVWVLTALPVLLWQFGWYSGWDNSFNKGYEQFSVGQFISVAGIVTFLPVMLYLPLAQARQAVTGDWRTFYQFKTVWRLIQRRRLACLVLAGVYSLVSFPLALTRVLPSFITSNNPAFAAMSDAELLDWANNYYFWVSAAGFAAYALLHLLAARIYAGAVVEACRAGALTQRELSVFERHMLSGLQLIELETPGKPHIAIKIVAAAARPAWRAAMTTATLMIWFSFVAQIYVSEFFVYHQARGFINQPLIQLPWFRYVPVALEESAQTELAGVVNKN